MFFFFIIIKISGSSFKFLVLITNFVLFLYCRDCTMSLIIIDHQINHHSYLNLDQTWFVVFIMNISSFSFNPYCEFYLVFEFYLYCRNSTIIDHHSYLNLISLLFKLRRGLWF